MKAIKVLLLPLLVLITVFSAYAQQFSVKTYQLIVKGTSSLHDWESTVEKLECTGSLSFAGDDLADLDKVVVKIPVKSIKSTKGKMMDNKTWEAFNHEKHPLIIFKLSQEKIDSKNHSIAAPGNLTMAGISRPIDLTLTYKVLPGGDLKVTGHHKLNMKDFKMDPPTAMMGTIKVGEEVEITFELILTTENNTL